MSGEGMPHPAEGLIARLRVAIESRRWGEAAGVVDVLRLRHGWKYSTAREAFGESWEEFSQEMDDAQSRGES